MNCDRFDQLLSRDRLGEADEAALLSHLESCPACAARASREAALADALAAAAATAGRVKRTARRAASSLLAASLLVSIGLSIRMLRRSELPAVYVIRGDSTGVVLTGPGISRRSESAPRVVIRKRKGDRT